jgi:hypothetical protein
MLDKLAFAILAIVISWKAIPYGIKLIQAKYFPGAKAEVPATETTPAMPAVVDSLDIHGKLDALLALYNTADEGVKAELELLKNKIITLGSK